MHFSYTGLLTGLLALAAASPVPDSHVLHEKRDTSFRSASRWVKRDRLSGNTVLPVRIGLKQQNLHKGAEWLMDV